MHTTQPIPNRFKVQQAFQGSVLFLAAFTFASECRSETPAEKLNAASSTVPVVMGTVIVITGSRVEQPSFDLPVSIDRIDRDTIQDGNAKVNLSETLIRAPGVVAQNRQNYAQDLQISVRGFGARSGFGVRGVRLYADGIPATMPDGQGQVSHFDLSSADRMEVLRGPFSALYGNSSGGVISLFSENGKPGFTLTPSVQYGSYATSNIGLKASGDQADVNYLVSATHFSTDGYREHSAATRDTVNAKLLVGLGTDSTLTLIANAVSMDDIDDPLGLNRAQFEASPRSVHPNALLFNTRKSVNQQQLGLKYDKELGAKDTLQMVLYGGSRSAIQYLAIPESAQVAPTSSGGVIDLARLYSGIDLRWVHGTKPSRDAVQWTAGISYDNLDEDRRGYENFSGTTRGVQGRLRRDEQNNVRNFDQYIQAQWEPHARWLVLAGVRNSSIHVRSEDHYIATGNGDDSGAVSYRSLNAVLGATFKYSQRVNFYAAYGEGFETPTLNELSYRPGTPTPSGFNFDLKPARSDNYEVGVKAYLGGQVRANLAVFHIDTEDEIVVLSNTGGRSVFQNAGGTRRKGVELALAGGWSNGIDALLAYTWLQAQYAEPFCSGPCSPGTQVAAGNRIPGVPEQTLYGELSWQYRPLGFSAALEAKYTGKVYVNDINSDTAPAYFIANVRAGFEQKWRAGRFKQFVRVDNIGDRHYAGSVIVNEGNQRYFEPAPGRNYLVGVTASYTW